MTKNPIRVLVVEDSLTVREHIVQTIESDPTFQVVGQAQDGRTAIELCESLKPDVVTMDMVLPVMTGLAATEHIMAFFPTPILIVSASTNRGELFETYAALAAGAVDVLEKPSGTEVDDEWRRSLLQMLRVVSRIRVITHIRGRRTSPEPIRPPTPRAPGPSAGSVVAIGVSTGGPSALLAIFRELPHDFPLPILVVQHIAEPFAVALAQWLDSQVALEVRYAIDGEHLPSSGRVLLAPPDRHLEVVNGHLHLSRGPERHSCRPSVDVLFESIAREYGAGAVGCLLTGMGRDGALGLLAIKRNGGLALVQDRESSVVYGMPGEAVKLGAAHRVLPLSAFAPTLTRLPSARPQRR